MDSKLENIEQRIESLSHKVDQITPSQPSHCSHQQPMHEVNKEGTNAEELATNEDEAKSTCVQLRFPNEMKPPIYHDDEIKAENNEVIRIGIFNGDHDQVRLSFEACGRDRRGNVLAGKRTVQLINGEVSLGTIKFREGSCRARGGKFILAARVCNGGAKTGVKVQEAVMMPVVVQDRRNKSNGKSHPPKLNDKVHRLEEIAINGIYCKRFAEKGIENVEDFLKALNKDPDNLANILHIKKESKAWEKMVTHARECSLDGKNELKSYQDGEQRNVVFFFNCVHFLVGARFDDGYIASDKLNSAQKFIVDKLKEKAYQLLDGLPFDHIMEGDIPILNPMNANAGGHHGSYQVQGTEAVVCLDHAQIEPSIANSNNERNYQDQSTRQSGQEQFSASGAGWSHGPITQVNPSYQTNNGFCPGAEDDFIMGLLNDEADYSGQTNCGATCDDPFQGASMAPGFDQLELQRQPLCRDDILEAPTSTHSNLPCPPQQQLTFSGAPGSSAQVNMQKQSQGQAAMLPSNRPSEASTSTQGNLPTQQWPQTQYQGSNFWQGRNVKYV
ncbi:hypothetical protein E2562_003999 [Oryza meyeriana var. granulata]|uniref:Uncharacterized protein n=1 Tax=Oryza meyeriana var. granulata TaxID=110450 RepID=A0A6G1BJ88_9ORYZ|nr:hypothetical protein E2562_003999 [Oryza meyeriana var. granulata]